MIWSPDIDRLRRSSWSPATWRWPRSAAAAGPGGGARDLGWWIVVVNQLGSVLFMVAAVASFVRPRRRPARGRDRQLGHPDRRPLLRHRRRDAGVRAPRSRPERMPRRWPAKASERAADRAGAAGDLAAAAAAALARGAARQRLGGRGRRRHRPVRHRDGRQGPAAPARPGAGPGRLRGRGRAAARLHPLPHRPLRARRADRRGAPAASSGCTRAGSTCGCSPTTPRRRSSADRGRAPERRAGRGAGALPRGARATSESGIDGAPGARPRAGPRGRGRDRPRRLAGPRDPRPRSLARRPAPARAQAADLRRPPARPHRPLLRLRPHAPTRSANSSPASTRSSRSTSTSSCPATAAPSATPRRRSPRPAARSPSCSAKCGRRWRRQERTAFEIVAEIIGPENVNTPASAWVLQIVLSCLDHLALAGEVEPVEGTDPQRWRSRSLSGDGELHDTSARWPRRPRSSSTSSPTTGATRDHAAAQGRARARGRAGAERGRRDPRAERRRAADARGSDRLRAAEPLLLQDPLRAAGARPRRHGRAEPGGGGTEVTYAVKTTPTIPLAGPVVIADPEESDPGPDRRRRERVRAPRRRCALSASSSTTSAHRSNQMLVVALARPGDRRQRRDRRLRAAEAPRRRPQPGRDRNFKPQKPPPPKQAKTVNWPVFGLNPARTRYLPVKGVKPPFANSGATPTGRCSSSRRSTSAASSTRQQQRLRLRARRRHRQSPLGTADRPPQRLLAGLLPPPPLHRQPRPRPHRQARRENRQGRSGNAPLPGRAESSPVVIDRTVYFGCENGELFAISTGQRQRPLVDPARRPDQGRAGLLRRQASTSATTAAT